MFSLAFSSALPCPRLSRSPAPNQLAPLRSPIFTFTAAPSPSSRPRPSPTRIHPRILSPSARLQPTNEQHQQNQPTSRPHSNTLLHTLIPILFFTSATLPFPSLADVASTATTTSPNKQAVDDFVSEAAKDNSLVSNILGTTVLFLLVYATVGVIILSINSFWQSRNSKREIAMIEQKLKEVPGRKTLTDDPTVVKSITGKTPPPGPPLAGNRESRRLEKKMREKELREQKKRERKQAANKATADTDSKTNS